MTPLRDGMNLVAKEFVAAQDPADPGVLVLSRFAGAAQQLKGALAINPHDAHEMADALDRALAMPLAERCERWQALLGGDREPLAAGVGPFVRGGAAARDDDQRGARPAAARRRTRQAAAGDRQRAGAGGAAARAPVMVPDVVNLN